MTVLAFDEEPAIRTQGASGTPKTSITVDILEGRGGTMPDIEREWNECLKSAPEHEQLFGYHWYAAWLEHLGREDDWTGDIRVLVARNSARQVVGILPLAKRRLHGITFWALAGYYQPHRGFVCLPEHQETICTALAQALLGMQGWREILRFGPYDTSSPERRLLMEELARRCGRLSQFDQERTIVARDIPPSSEAYRKMLQSHSSMKRVLSYERRMEREGEAQIRHFHNPGGEELRKMLADCAAIEGASWLAGSEEGRPRFMSQASKRYWEHVCAKQLGPQGQLNVWLAYFNGEPAAFRFTITTGSIRYMIANQYDERFERYRLGWILYLRDLEDCARHGVRSIDMGNGNLGYKSRWGGKEEAMGLTVIVWPPGPLGYLASWLASLNPIHRRIRRRI